MAYGYATPSWSRSQVDINDRLLDNVSPPTAEEWGNVLWRSKIPIPQVFLHCCLLLTVGACQLIRISLRFPLRIFWSTAVSIPTYIHTCIFFPSLFLSVGLCNHPPHSPQYPGGLTIPAVILSCARRISAAQVVGFSGEYSTPWYVPFVGME